MVDVNRGWSEIVLNPLQDIVSQIDRIGSGISSAITGAIPAIIGSFGSGDTMSYSNESVSVDTDFSPLGNGQAGSASPGIAGDGASSVSQPAALTTQEMVAQAVDRSPAVVGLVQPADFPKFPPEEFAASQAFDSGVYTGVAQTQEKGFSITD